MSLDLLTIGLGFQTDGLEKGTAALKNNEQAAHKAADAADNASSKMRIMSDAQKAAASATEKVRESIDKQVSAMRQQVETFGMSERQSKLYKLSIDGATESQLKQAEAALKQVDALKRAGEMGESAGRAIKVGALAAVAGIGATIAAFEMLIGKVSQYQDLAEQTGGDPAGIASLRTAADVGGASIEQLIASANRMQRSLAAVDDESKGVGRALGAIGIEVESFKKLRADEQIKAVAKAMSGYEDGLGKVAVMNEIFGRGSAALIPTMKELATQTGTNNGLTTEQIKLADDYKDAQARAKSELMQFAEQMAVAALPMVTAFTGAVQDTLKELFSLDSQGNKLAKSNDVADFAEVAATSLASLVDIGYGVAQVFNLIGNNIGAALAQATEFAKGNFEGAAEIGRASNEFNSKLSFSLGLSEKLEARIKSIKSAAKDNPQDGGNEKQLEYHSKAVKAVKAVADEYAKLSAEIAKQLALSQAELDGNGKLEASEKYRITTLEKLIEQYQVGKITLKEYIDLESKMNDVQGVMEKAEAQAKAAKSAQAAYAESLQFQDDVNKALREEEDARNRIRLAVGANTVAAEEAQQLAQLEMQTVFASAEDRKRILDYYRIELDLRKKIAAINSAGGIDQAERDRLIAIETANAARLKGVADMGAAMQSTTSIWQSIDQTAHTVWTNVLQGGQDVWSKLKNTAKSVFFDWLYQMTLKKWIFSIGATVSGSGAMAQTASGSAGGLGGVINTGKSIYNAATGSGSWFSDFGGSLAGSVSDFGSTLVDKGFTNLGTSIESFGLDISSASGTINMLGDGLGYLNSIVSISKGQWGAGIGSAIGTYFGGPIGAMIGSNIGGWVDSMTGGGTKPSIESGYSNTGRPVSAGAHYTQAADGSWSYGGAQDGVNKSMVLGAAADYGQIVKATGRTAGAFTGQSYMGFDGNGGSKGSQNYLDFGATLNGAEVYNRFADKNTRNAGFTKEDMAGATQEATTKSVLAALAATDLGPQLNKYLDSVKINGASLAEVTASLGDVTNYISVSNALKNLPFPYLTDMSVEASKALISAAGGIENFGTNISTYFDLFGTEAEKTAALTGNLSDGFRAIGLTMPASTEGLREWYKSEVARLGAMDLSIAANAEAYNSALKLASGVDQLVPSVEDATAAMAKQKKQLEDTNASWQDKIDLLTGAKTQDQISRQADLAGATDESTRALIDQYYAQKGLKDAADAAAKALAEAAAKEKAIADQRLGIENQILQLTGSTVELRRRELATLDPANRALQQYLYTLTDAKTALDAANAAASKINGERNGLESTYLQLMGDTNTQRERQIAALDPVNQAMARQINALTDLKAAYDAGTAKYQAVTNERLSLEGKFLQMSGNTAALRAKELAALDPANRTLQQYLYTLDDATAAQAKLDAAVQKTINERNSLETAIMQKLGMTAALRQRELDALDPANRALQQYLYSLEDQTAALSTAYSALDRAVNAQKSALSEQKAALSTQQQAAQSAISSLQSVFDTLGRSIVELRAIASGVLGNAAQGNAVINAAIASGVNPALQTLTDAIAAARGGLVADNFSSATDMAFANAELASRLSSLQAIASPQLTAAQAQLKAIEDQSKQIDEQIKLLDDQLKAAKEQIDAINGVDNSVKSVSEAIREFNAALTAKTTAQNVDLKTMVEAAKTAATAQTEAARNQSEAIAALTLQTTKAFAEAQAKAEAAEAIRTAAFTSQQELLGHTIIDAFAASMSAEAQIIANAQAAYQAALNAMVGVVSGLVGSVAAANAAATATPAAATTTGGAVFGGTGGGINGGAIPPSAGGSAGGNPTGATTTTNGAVFGGTSTGTGVYSITPSTAAQQAAAAIEYAKQASQQETIRQFYQTAALTQQSAAAKQMSEFMAAQSAFESGLPSFAVGTDYVPHDMIAQIHEGERITPKAFNPVIPGNAGGNNTARLEALVSELTAEVVALRGQVSTTNANTKVTADALSGRQTVPLRTILET